jgi:hypothetical protein
MPTRQMSYVITVENGDATPTNALVANPIPLPLVRLEMSPSHSPRDVTSRRYGYYLTIHLPWTYTSTPHFCETFVKLLAILMPTVKPELVAPTLSVTCQVYGTVWYDPGGICNILSLSRVNKKYHVSYDSEHGNCFVVTKPDGTAFKFEQSDSGLFYLDTSICGVSLVTSVADNKSRYTNADYMKAVTARNLQIKIGRPVLRTSSAS